MMHILRYGQRTVLALLLGLSASLSAQAGYSNVYFFGDSLSDTGNLYTTTGGAMPASPYYDGRFSNGPVWSEYLASGLGLSGAASPFLAGGNNYAWGGAMSGTDGLADALINTPTGLQTQVTGYWAATHPLADPGALYVIDIGANDLIGIAQALPDASDAAARLAQAEEVVANLMFSVNYLIDHGARYFLITNAPDLGVTPIAMAGGFTDAAHDLSVQYNALLTAALNSLAGQANIVSLDLFNLIDTLVDDANAGGNTYGLANGPIPCILGLNSCDDSVFFDDMHPTAAVHALAGQMALAAANSLQTPEPAGISLLLAALLAAGFVRRRSPSAAAA